GRAGSDVVRTQVAGEVDSSESGPADVLPAVEKGAELRFVGAAIHGLPYGISVRPKIASWAELADKTFGVSAPGSAPHLFALAMLEAYSVPTENIRIANVAGTVRRIKALAAGRFDAAAASSEFVPLAD